MHSHQTETDRQTEKFPFIDIDIYKEELLSLSVCLSLFTVRRKVENWSDVKNMYSVKLVSQEGMFSVGIGPIRLKLPGKVVGEVR